MRAQIYLSRFYAGGKLTAASICGTYLFHTSYATVGTPCDCVGYLQEIVIERRWKGRDRKDSR